MMSNFTQLQVIIKNMMISEILGSLILIGILFVVYTFWIKPKKIMKNYAKILRSKGFKVHEAPFNPFQNDMIQNLRKGTQQGDALKIYKQDYKDYDVIVTNMLIRPKLQFNNPDFIKEYYAVDKHYDYPKEQKIMNIFSRAAGHGLPFSEGKVWKRKRTILNKVFNFDFVKSQTGKISQVCTEALEQLQDRGKKISKNVVEYNILDLTVRIFSGVMMDSFLGGTKNQMINGQPAGKFLKKLIADLSEQSFYPINFLLGTKFLSLGITKQQRYIQNRVQIYRKWGLQFIRNRIKEINAELETNKDKKAANDIIQALLMSKRNANAEEAHEQISTQEEIFEEFNSFFIAGTDTTSNFTQMMIYQIAKHVEIERKVREQIQKYMKENDYSYENLKNFTYIDNLQKQTTRCFGPGTHLFSRTAKVDNYLNGIPIKKGTAISIMVMGNHFNQKYFKNPKQFRPERWESECDNLPPFVFGGFSAGARTCIGKHLAMLQSKIALIMFMKRYEKIELGNPNFKMRFQFLYSPERFDTKLYIKQEKASQ